MSKVKVVCKQCGSEFFDYLNKITFGKDMPETITTWGLNLKSFRGGQFV